LGANEPIPQLITDFTAYNTGGPLGSDSTESLAFGPAGPHGIGDLALGCTISLESDKGEIVLDLVRGGKHFYCRISAANGDAQLGYDGGDALGFHPKAATPLKGEGPHEVLFSNIDDQLRLWVDGRLMAFDGDDGKTIYDSRKLKLFTPGDDDYLPAGIAARNGAAFTATHLKVFRDIYYSAVMARKPEADWSAGGGPAPRFTTESNTIVDEENGVDFLLKDADPRNPAKDQFFVLGDNSKESADSRHWDKTRRGMENEYWVERELLIGKALFIYWPHSWNRVPYFNIPFPYFPNFQRMHFVR
jgi:hypothetical protein